MDKLDSAIKGVYNLLNKKIGNHTDEKVVKEILTEYAVGVADSATKMLTDTVRIRKDKTIYASEVGKPCARQLWYKINMPFAEGGLPPATKIKFHYGDSVEGMLIALLKLSGAHLDKVQERVEVPLPNGWTITGRSDAVVDGHLVDIKSVSAGSFVKLNDKTLTPFSFNDPFGYVMQLAVYGKAFTKDKGSLLLVNKETGQIGRTKPILLTPIDGCDVVAEATMKTDLVEEAGTTPPKRLPSPLVSAPASTPAHLGDRKLCATCAYCDFKHECWKNANSGSGPVAHVTPTGGVVWLIDSKKTMSED